jgi:hypothetical protein
MTLVISDDVIDSALATQSDTSLASRRQTLNLLAFLRQNLMSFVA